MRIFVLMVLALEAPTKYALKKYCDPVSEGAIRDWVWMSRTACWHIYGNEPPLPLVWVSKIVREWRVGHISEHPDDMTDDCLVETVRLVVAERDSMLANLKAHCESWLAEYPAIKKCPFRDVFLSAIIADRIFCFVALFYGLTSELLH